MYSFNYPLLHFMLPFYGSQLFCAGEESAIILGKVKAADWSRVKRKQENVRALECVLAHILRELLLQFQTKHVVMKLGYKAFKIISQSLSTANSDLSLTFQCYVLRGI